MKMWKPCLIVVHLLAWAVLFLPVASASARDQGAADVPAENTVDCYRPIDGGWQIHITADPKALRLKTGDAMGVVGNKDRGAHLGSAAWHTTGAVPDNARLHRRPLYPPADRTLVWTEEDLAGRQPYPGCGLPHDLLERRRIPFRPMILAANEPRFVVDLDSAGGLSGHLLLGLSLDHGPSKWLHQFGDLNVRYVNGRMEYALHDAAFPGVTVRLVVMPLAECVGLVMKIRVEGLSQPGDLLWVFGGASALPPATATTTPIFALPPINATIT